MIEPFDCAGCKHKQLAKLISPPANDVLDELSTFAIAHTSVPLTPKDVNGGLQDYEIEFVQALQGTFAAVGEAPAKEICDSTVLEASSVKQNIQHPEPR